jgi:MFS family permease
MPHRSRRWALDRSLVVLTGVVVVSSVGSGMPWYTMGILFTPLTAEFDWGRGAYSIATSLFILSLNLSALPIGSLVDRWGSRRMMGIMGVASCLVWMLISQVGRLGQQAILVQLYALYALLGIASSGLGNVPCSALVARWFKKRRGLAMGVSLIGGSLPGVILVPLSAPLIDAYGWRAFTAGLGLLALVASIPTVLWIIRDPPDEPEPKSGAVTQTPVATPSHSAREALRMPSFWIIGVAFALGLAASVAIQMHAIPFLMDRGLTRATASSIWGFLALWGIIGKVALGWAADRFSAKAVYSVSLLAQALAVVIAFASASPAAAWGFAMLFGLGMGGQICTRATIVAEYYGVRAYGTIWGLVTLFTLPGTVGGGPLAGFLYDISGNYRTPYAIFVVAFVLGAAAVLLLRKPRVTQQVG